MKLVELKYTDRDVAQMRRINDEAFPENERLSIDQLFIEQEGVDKRFLGIYDDEDRFCGFFMLIVTDDCAYVCYFAIDPSRRNGGLGSRAIGLLHEYCGKRQIVVDFESLDEKAENNDQRMRRRAFYLRNGFYATGYYQYYMDCEFEIVCSHEDYDRPAYEALLEGIKRHVGNYLTPHYRKD